LPAYLHDQGRLVPPNDGLDGGGARTTRPPPIVLILKETVEPFGVLVLVRGSVVVLLQIRSVVELVSALLELHDILRCEALQIYIQGWVVAVCVSCASQPSKTPTQTTDTCALHPSFLFHRHRRGRTHSHNQTVTQCDRLQCVCVCVAIGGNLPPWTKP
jgi:hypothetical protein